MLTCLKACGTSGYYIFVAERQPLPLMINRPSTKKSGLGQTLPLIISAIMIPTLMMWHSTIFSTVATYCSIIRGRRHFGYLRYQYNPASPPHRFVTRITLGWEIDRSFTPTYSSEGNTFFTLDVAEDTGSESTSSVYSVQGTIARAVPKYVSPWFPR